MKFEALNFTRHASHRPFAPSRNHINLIQIKSVNLDDRILGGAVSNLSPHKFKAAASDLKFRGADLGGEIRVGAALLTAAKF